MEVDDSDLYAPFDNLQNLAIWILYHSNFVNRKSLPQFLCQHMYGLAHWLGLSEAQRQEKLAEARSVINKMSTFYLLLTPWEYTGPRSGKRLGWVSEW